MTGMAYERLSETGRCLRRMTVGLGTFVTIDAAYPEPALAAAAPNPLDIVAAVIDIIEARMHPTREGSDLTALAAAAIGEPVTLHDWTSEVLTLAKRLCESSRGVFDPCLPDRPGRLSDLELLAPNRAYRCGPELHIDLGGIAKGFAIDRIVEALQAAGCIGGLVNAGGDVRVFGPDAWRVQICARGIPERAVTLKDEALAVSEPKSPSSPSEHQGYYSRITGGTVEGRPVAIRARSAAVADALTKCAILSSASDMERLLSEYGARSVTL